MLTLDFSSLKHREFEEDWSHREVILSRLLMGLMVLSLIAVLTVVEHYLEHPKSYIGSPPAAMLIALAFFSGLLILKKYFPKLAAWLFLLTIFLSGTASLYLWGVILPQGLLMYALCITVAGIILGNGTSLLFMLLESIAMFIITRGDLSGNYHPDLDWIKHGVGYADPLIFTATFAVMVLISWLYNRELIRSLNKARQSEGELLQERELLEQKVAERTKELELAQYEKTLELQRFAEFGRITSGLIHDIANPLTAASLHLQQINMNTEEITYVKKSIGLMEKYVTSVRKQLQNSGELVWFYADQELKEVVSILQYKADRLNVKLVIGNISRARVYGDKARFNQILANLIANAIDAYEDHVLRTRKVNISLSLKGNMMEIEVKDFGVGISQLAMKRLFEPFFSTKSKNRGIGVGLLITKEFVEIDFKGKIHVSSDKEEGTIFTVCIPVTHNKA